MANGQKQNDDSGDQIVFEAPGLEPEELIERSAAILRGFVQIPNGAIVDHRLSAEEYRLYSLLRHYARRGDHCWPGQAKLAASLNVKERSIRRYLRGLRAAGYLSWSKRFGTTNVYVILHVPIRSEMTGLGEPLQSGHRCPLNPVTAVRSIRSPLSAQSGQDCPTEEEKEEEYAEEEHADGIPPSAGELADANSSPASDLKSPEGGSAPLTPVAEGSGVAAPQQTSFLAPPPSDPPRRRRRKAAVEGPGNWVAEFSTVHRERCGGEFESFGEAGKLLKALRAEHGHELLLAAWRLYVAATEVKWVRVRGFAAKPKPWLDQARTAAGGASAPKLVRQEPAKTRAEAIARLTGGRRVA